MKNLVSFKLGGAKMECISFELTLVNEYYRLSFVLNNSSHHYTPVEITAIMKVYCVNESNNFRYDIHSRYIKQIFKRNSISAYLTCGL